LRAFPRAGRAEQDDDVPRLYKRMAGWSSKASVEVERRRGRGLKAGGGRRETPGKVLRIGVHHANGVVWEPVYRTTLSSGEVFPDLGSSPSRGDAAASSGLLAPHPMTLGESDG
jgi:hypothetical protein